MTPSGIEQATFRFVAQHLYHCATAVPRCGIVRAVKSTTIELIFKVYRGVVRICLADIMGIYSR